MSREELREKINDAILKMEDGDINGFTLLLATMNYVDTYVKEIIGELPEKPYEFKDPTLKTRFVTESDRDFVKYCLISIQMKRAGLELEYEIF